MKKTPLLPNKEGGEREKCCSSEERRMVYRLVLQNKLSSHTLVASSYSHLFYDARILQTTSR